MSGPSERASKKVLWTGLLVSLTLLERAVLWIAYPPITSNDTGGYRHLAQAILDGWGGYDGARTPGYPAFLALFGPDRSVYRTQLALGLGITLLLFFTAWLVTRDLRLGLLAGLAHTLNLGQLFYETYLLSETLATFWIVLSVAGAAVWLALPARRSLLLAAGIGLCSGLAGLTRPLYAFLPFWLAFTLWILPAFQALPGLRSFLRRLDWQVLLGLGIPGLLIIGSWVGYIHSRTGTWNLTIVTGMHLTQHTGNYFEYAPDEYADLREIFLRYRQERIVKYGTAFNTIWSAYPEMMQSRDLNLFQLSQVLTRISFRLIREHPGLYLRYAGEGWINFWKPPVKWAPGQVESAAVRQVLSGVILIERMALFAANLAFLASSLLALVSTKARQLWKINPFWALLAVTVWITSILQTLPEHGDNHRFLIPMQSLVVMWVLWVAWTSIPYLQKQWVRRGSMVQVSSE